MPLIRVKMTFTFALTFALEIPCFSAILAEMMRVISLPFLFLYGCITR